jgi:type III secretion protein Q
MYTHDLEAGSEHPAGTATSARHMIRLREIDSVQAQLARRMGCGLQAGLWLDAATTLRMEASGLRPASAPPPHRPLLLQTQAGALSLSPAREIVRALASIDLPDDAGTDALHAMRLDMAAQALPTGCLPLFGASTFLVGHGDGSNNAPGPLEVTLTIFQPQARLGMVATLRGTAEALLHALSQAEWQSIDDGKPAPEPQDMQITVPVCIGTTTVSLPTLDALAPGDIVVVAHPRFDLDGEGELQIAKGFARCVLHTGNHTQVELTEWHPTTAGPTMNDEQEYLGAREVNHDEPLDDVPVTLSFELGSLELTLADLRTLAPGRVLDIAGELPPLVAICAGRRRIGLGELVDLGGRLAVEVRRIGASS